MPLIEVNRVLAVGLAVVLKDKRKEPWHCANKVVKFGKSAVVRIVGRFVVAPCWAHCRERVDDGKTRRLHTAGPVAEIVNATIIQSPPLGGQREETGHSSKGERYFAIRPLSRLSVSSFAQ